jgi:hypothetical protein
MVVWKQITSLQEFMASDPILAILSLSQKAFSSQNSVNTLNVK